MGYPFTQLMYRRGQREGHAGALMPQGLDEPITDGGSDQLLNPYRQVTNAFSSSSVSTFPGVLENQGLDFLALTIPGVANSRDAGFSNTNGVGFSVNGIRGRNNDQQVDGQNNNDNSVGGPGLTLSDPHFVDEYQIVAVPFHQEDGAKMVAVCVDTKPAEAIP